MKKMSKLLSVMIALMLCVSMIAPAMALDITQDYIDGLDVKTHETYGTKYVEVKGQDENDTTFNMTEDIKTNYTLYFGDGNDVTLNMNGHTLDHQDKAGSVIMAENTNLTINGEGDDGSMGTITGGNAYEKNQLPGAQEADCGGGISVKGGSLTVNDTVISGNTASSNGSAVFAKDSDSVSMNNVDIKDNKTTGETTAGGGTVSIHGTDEVNLNNVTINGNTSAGVGGGLSVQNSGTVNMNEVEITNNHANGDGTYSPSDGSGAKGGGVYASNVDEINMNGVTISGNTANTTLGAGGGVYAENVGSIGMNKTQITGNSAGIGGGMYIVSGGTTTVTGEKNTVIADNMGWCGAYANDVAAATYGNGEIDMKFGPATYGEGEDAKVFDGWSNSLKFDFEREGEDAGTDGVFGNNYSNGGVGYMTFHWTDPVDPEQPGPNPPVVPEPPVVPTPDPDPVEIEDPETPLGEEPEDPEEIEEPEIPLGEEPEIEIDEPELPLSDVPQTGDISFMWYGAVIVSVMGLLGLSLLERKKRQEN